MRTLQGDHPLLKGTLRTNERGWTQVAIAVCYMGGDAQPIVHLTCPSLVFPKDPLGPQLVMAVYA